MIEFINKFDIMLYAIHLKDPSNPDSPGTLLGSCSLRVVNRIHPTPELPPPPPPSDKPLNVRTLGYALLEPARGKGYCPEACAAMIAAYKEYRKGFPEEQSYIEACVGRDNPQSISLLRKVGFQRVGFKELPEGAFLAGKMREAGYDVYGLYV
jgi:RimJ/RimL family protein N-acetyltransferase